MNVNGLGHPLLRRSNSLPIAQYLMEKPKRQQQLNGSAPPLNRHHIALLAFHLNHNQQLITGRKPGIGKHLIIVNYTFEWALSLRRGRWGGVEYMINIRSEDLILKREYTNTSECWKKGINWMSIRSFIRYWLLLRLIRLSMGWHWNGRGDLLKKKTNLNLNDA